MGYEEDGLGGGEGWRLGIVKVGFVWLWLWVFEMVFVVFISFVY